MVNSVIVGMDTGAHFLSNAKQVHAWWENCIFCALSSDIVKEFNLMV